MSHGFFFFFKFHFKRKRRAVILFVRRERASLTIWASEGLGERRPLCRGSRCPRGRPFIFAATHTRLASLLAGPGHTQQLRAVFQVLICVTGRRSGGGGGSLSPPRGPLCWRHRATDQHHRHLFAQPGSSMHRAPPTLSPSLPFLASIPLLPVGLGLEVSMDSWPRPAVPRAFHRTHMHTCTHPPGPACQPGSRAQAIFL